MLLPEEIANLSFEIAFRGYSIKEVGEFLDKLKNDVQEMLKDQEALKRKVAAAELLAKDAEDQKDEFMASMQADRDAAAEALESAKAEGERIIREAKNAATGIMTEVRRRAGEISAETRRASAVTVDDAKRKAAEILAAAEREAERIAGDAADAAAKLTAEAESEAARITDAAKSAAEHKLYAARTEAENTVNAANAEARAIVAEARQKNDAAAERAVKAVALCTEYITEIRATADSVCRELDIELKNAAARISILGGRISKMEVQPPVIGADRAEDDGADGDDGSRVSDRTETPAQVYEEDHDASADEAAESYAEPAQPAGPAQPGTEVPPSDSGYFTEEYRQVMEELFGSDVDLSSGGMPEDDDTYDYLDKMSVAHAAVSAVSGDEDGEDDEDAAAAADDGTVTSEYTGIPGDSEDEDLLDVFSSSTVDKVYKAPTDDDINNILNGF